MLKFVNTVVLEDDGKDEYNSEAEVAVAMLSAEVLWLMNEYDKIFSGLDAVIKAFNESIERQ